MRYEDAAPCWYDDISQFWPCNDDDDGTPTWPLPPMPLPQMPGTTHRDHTEGQTHGIQAGKVIPCHGMVECPIGKYHRMLLAKAELGQFRDHAQKQPVAIGGDQQRP